MYWQALRGRLLTRPASYAGVSLLAVTVDNMLMIKYQKIKPRLLTIQIRLVKMQ